MFSEIVIRFGAIMSYFFFYKICPRCVLGPDAEYWDVFRYRSLWISKRLFGWVLHTDRPIRNEEFAGVLPMNPNEAERVLWENGFHRNPVAAVKTRNGTPEIGSWVRREHPKAKRQLHIMLFHNPSGKDSVDVYAHEEFSSVNLNVAVRHYRGIDQRARLGVERAKKLLPLVQTERNS